MSRYCNPDELRSPGGRPLCRPLIFLLRSLYPLFVLILLLGTIAWGPWVTLAGSIVAWNIVTRYA